ncbi:presequence protease, mitochondrial [Onthophagus taurus]|uniref:presequence protease, mitochondrial n=1 Tax=Onthophagus taurus TaxID=166361 RepID=UPI000C1FDC13|nr:presequence protease, mitochondrial [Onthophagus taurus]XP_022921203.1 presequence protease, mitochondrial [Onthophagus taurus]
MLRKLTNLKLNLYSVHQIIRQSSQAITKAELQDDGSVDISGYKVGTRAYGFEVKDLQNITEFNITALRLMHLKTQSEYLHLYRNDNNNVFSICFRTTPMDSSGLPHILEHTVLCGSKLYPVRDPFFKMLNRSLATFMNAMTGSDYTLYPFSTQNFQDFCNLQKIYLDAVFRPNLSYLDFLQEGWRLENVNPEDPKTDLIIKGIVYNEMKGAFSENERILEQKVQNLILPDHTYGYVSGGDPLKIPSLTWEDLKNFHKKSYHPSNARFYSYGNFPLSPTLKYLDETYLSSYEYQNPSESLVPSQKRWDGLKKVHSEGRYDNLGDVFEKQNALTISLVMTDVTNVYEVFLLSFLTELLIKGPNAPFYKSMIEPNISGGFIPCTGLDTQPRDSIFTIGLQGLKVDDFETVQELFEKTINDVIANGFESKHIESVLHRYEISVKHEMSSFGLNLLFGLIPTWNHGGDIISCLRVNNLLDRLRSDLKNDSKFLQNTVEKYFKKNNHKLILTMSPDKEYESKLLQQENELIKSKVATLTDEIKQSIYDKGLLLLKEQSAEQNKELLPTLTMQDINNDVEHVQTEKIKIGPVPTQINKVNSNGITYFRGIINTSQLTPEQHMLLPLFCYIITKMGTKTMNYREFDNLVMTKTTGLNISVHFAESLYQLHVYEPGILLSSYCLDHNVDAMWDLWTEIFNLTEFKDVKRFETLTHLYMTSMTQGVAESGHLYAMQSAAGLVSGAAYQKDLLTGLQHISYMRTLMKTRRYESILTELAQIAKLLFDKNNLRCSLNLLESSQATIVGSYEKFITKLPGNRFGVPNETTFNTGKVWAPTDAINCHHHVINVPIHFCSKGILTTPYTNADYAKLRVLGRLLSARYLHPELREKRGAYGSGARINSDGVFTFYSYRDPNHLATLDIFDKSYSWLHSDLSKVTNQDILEAKLGVFQAVDAPLTPSNKGMREFLMGISPDILQRHRADIMVVNRDGLKDVSEKYLSRDSPSQTSKVILGPKSENLNTASRTKELWTTVENEQIG